MYRSSLILIFFFVRFITSAQVVTTYSQSDARLFGNEYIFTKTDSTSDHGTFAWEVATDDGGGWLFEGTYTETGKHILLKYNKPIDSTHYVFNTKDCDTGSIWLEWYQENHFVARPGNALEKWAYSSYPYDTSRLIIEKAHLPKKEITNGTIIVKTEEHNKDSIIVKVPENNLCGIVVYYTPKWYREQLEKSSTILKKVTNGFIATGMWEGKKGKKVLFTKHK